MAHTSEERDDKPALWTMLLPHDARTDLAEAAISSGYALTLERSATQRATYFDTFDGALYRAGFGLRVVRRSNRTPVTLAVPGGLRALLGVRWLSGRHGWTLDAQRAAWASLAPAPP